jgi:hypothetical protein
MTAYQHMTILMQRVLEEQPVVFKYTQKLKADQTARANG